MTEIKIVSKVFKKFQDVLDMQLHIYFMLKTPWNTLCDSHDTMKYHTLDKFVSFPLRDNESFILHSGRKLLKSIVSNFMCIEVATISQYNGVNEQNDKTSNEFSKPS